MGTAETRGYGTDWKKLRAIVLARDGYACQARGCGEVATHVDHIVAKAEGATDELENLQSLCAQHHR